MIKAVIFDLDGVLVTTDELHFQAWKQLAEELGIEGFTKADNARQRGVSRMASLEVVLEKTENRKETCKKTYEKKNDTAYHRLPVRGFFSCADACHDRPRLSG